MPINPFSDEMYRMLADPKYLTGDGREAIKFGRSLVTKAMDAITEVKPDLWRMCYPRIYEEPKHGSFHSPKDVGYQLFESVLKFERGDRGPSEQFEFLVANRLAQYRVPIFFVAPAMMEAVKNTATPQEIEWLDMPLPFEAATFMVPRGTLRHPDEGEVLWIGYARVPPDFEARSPFNPKLNVGCQKAGMTLVAKTEMGYYHHWNIADDTVSRVITLQDIEEIKDTLPVRGASVGPTALTVTQEDNNLMVPVAHYIFSLALIMTERPTMVETGALRKKVAGKRDHPPREFWSPNVIGREYQIRKERGGPAEGSHASPRLHFVRGFWRQQAHGPKRSLRRDQWIEPFLRGA